MPLQVTPDWSIGGTAADLERELTGFKFKGPGFYLQDDYTILVVLDLMLRLPDSATWKTQQPEGCRYQLYVYDVPFIETIFAQVAIAPVKEDTRKL